MRTYWKYGAVLFWVIVVSVFLFELYEYAFVQGFGLQRALVMFSESLQTKLMGYGSYAPFIFFTLYAIRPFVFFPASAMTLASIFLFGIPLGLVISYVGELLSAVIGFMFGKYLGQSFGVSEKMRKTKIGSYLSGNTFVSVFILRIVPIFPFDVVSFACGMARLPLIPYTLATMVGVIPGLGLYIFLGYSLVHTEYLLSAIFMLGIILIITKYTKLYVDKKRK